MQPRRKQRISIDPQNLQWSTDGNRFGKRMIERMGWHGGGLGRNENGIRENIRLKANQAQRGFGLDKNGKDTEWMAHHDEFARLLAELNEKKKEKEKATKRSTDDDGTYQSEMENEKSKKFKRKKASSNEIDDSMPSEASASIEERSRFSKVRIHYHRYVQAKNVSRYTVEEKSAIFGCASQQNKEEEEEVKNDNMINGSDNDKIQIEEQDKEEAKKRKRKNKHQLEAKCNNDDMEASRNSKGEMPKNGTCLSIGSPAGENSTTNAKMTMDQYFAEKMALKIRKRIAVFQ